MGEVIIQALAGIGQLFSWRPAPDQDLQKLRKEYDREISRRMSLIREMANDPHP